MRQRCLVIDDDEPFAQTLARTLTRKGFDTQTVMQVDKVEEVAQAFQPHRIVLDMKLGNQSGLTLIPMLKSLLPDCRIVVLTGYASIATAVRAVKDGAFNFVSKPLDLSVLLDAFESDRGLLEAQDVLSPRQIEWEHIQQVLANHEGNISSAARALGMHRRTLQRKLQKKVLR